MAVAAPLLALWGASPLVAYWASRRIEVGREELAAADEQEARLIARRTWRLSNRPLMRRRTPRDARQRRPHA